MTSTEAKYKQYVLIHFLVPFEIFIAEDDDKQNNFDLNSSLEFYFIDFLM